MWSSDAGSTARDGFAQTSRIPSTRVSAGREMEVKAVFEVIVRDDATLVKISSEMATRLGLVVICRKLPKFVRRGREM